MIRLSAATVLAALTLGLLWAPSPARAIHGILPEQHESVRDQMRCEALSKQFDEAVARQAVDPAAKEQASQGAVLCRSGRYGEGADTLEKALRMIGKRPPN